MIFSILVAILTAMVYSVAGLVLTSPPKGSTLSSEGLHSLTWTFTNTDPAAINIQIISSSNPTALTIILRNVPVPNMQISFSTTLPEGNGLIFQCANANNPSDIIAQSGPVNIVAGPLAAASALPPNETISVFSAPAGTGSIPVSTITNAVLTTSIPTVELVVSSAVETFTTLSELTTTTTLFTSPVNVTSTGTIIIPITTQNGNVPDPSPSLNPDIPFLQGEEVSPQFPLQIEVAEVITVAPVFILPTFKKWKRVADSTSIPLGAVTITGTRGVTTTTPTTTITPATTISATTAPPTTATTSTTATTGTTTTTTQSPVTVISVTTVPGTIITVTAPPPAGNQTQSLFSPAPPPVTSTVSQFPPPGQSTTTTIVTQSHSQIQSSSVPIQTIEECAICTSGLINAGIKLRGFGGGWWECVGWGVWISGVALAVWR